MAKQCILDVIGVAIAGASEPPSQIVREVAVPDSGPGRSSLIGRPAPRVDQATAALVNGTSAHALDYDDVLPAMISHPSAPVLPAALAAAEHRRVGGRALLEAFVCGYEVEARIGAAVNPSHYNRGFHTTGTVGTFGAATAVARLLGLDGEHTEMALGVAGAGAAGLKSQFGTMTKPLQAGTAAAAGLRAAHLAARGFTATTDVVTCPQGFAATQADTVDRQLLGAPFGSPWYVLHTLFKMHASCHYTHATIEALSKLRPEIRPVSVVTVTLRVHPDLLSVCDIRRPSTGLEGKFSLRHVAAVALLRGAAGPDQFTDEVVQDPEVRRLREHVEVEASDAVPHFTTRCTVRMADGRTLAATSDSQQPAWQHHPREQTEALVTKFTSLAGPVLGKRQTAHLADAVLHLDEVDDVTFVVPALDVQA